MSTSVDGRARQDDVAEVRRTLVGMSAAWQERRYADLLGFLAEDMVFALPGFGGRLEGAKAVVESYREFMERITLVEYAEAEPTVDVWAIRPSRATGAK